MEGGREINETVAETVDDSAYSSSAVISAGSTDEDSDLPNILQNVSLNSTGTNTNTAPNRFTRLGVIPAAVAAVVGVVGGGGGGGVGGVNGVNISTVGEEGVRRIRPSGPASREESAHTEATVSGQYRDPVGDTTEFVDLEGDVDGSESEFPVTARDYYEESDDGMQGGGVGSTRRVVGVGVANRVHGVPE